MRTRGLTAGALFVALSAVAAASVAEQEKTPAAMSADEKAMMDALAKAATPGEGHKKLEPFIGTFEAKVSTWMKPGAPPEVSAGTSTNKWVLGGRYVEQQYQGQMMGQVFEGIGYTGYDNVKKEYVSTWMDSMGTGIMMSTGKSDPSGKTMTLSGVMVDPLTGKSQTMQSKTTLTDNDHHTFEMYGPGPDGKTMKVLEIVYSRKQ